MSRMPKSLGIFGKKWLKNLAGVPEVRTFASAFRVEPLDAPKESVL